MKAHMRLVNLTPHPLSVVCPDGQTLQVPPSGTIARVAVTRRPAGQLRVEGASLDVHVVEYGDVEGLPEPEAGVIYVVSALVASRVPRPDVYAPGELVRDEAGRVVGCRGLTASVTRVHEALRAAALAGRKKR